MSELFKNENTIYWPRKQGLRKLLGDLELAVMDCVWATPPGTRLTIRAIYEALSAAKKMVYTTAQNTMQRLADKGLLAVDRSVYPHEYWAPYSKDEFTRKAVGKLLEDLLADFGEPALAHFSDATGGQAAMDELAHLISEIRKQRERES